MECMDIKPCIDYILLQIRCTSFFTRCSRRVVARYGHFPGRPTLIQIGPGILVVHSFVIFIFLQEGKLL